MKESNFLIFVSMILVISCSDAVEVGQRSLLNKTWVHSYEEKPSEEIEIYRPSDSSDLPLSRYRQVFHFDDENECYYSILAANDAHFMESGKWDYNDKTNILTIFNSTYRVLYEFEVLELTDNFLRLKAKN